MHKYTIKRQETAQHDTASVGGYHTEIEQAKKLARELASYDNAIYSVHSDGLKLWDTQQGDNNNIFYL